MIDLDELQRRTTRQSVLGGHGLDVVNMHGSDFDALIAELIALRARVAELERDARLVSETRAAWKDLDPVVRETTTGAFRVGLAAVRHFEAEEATEALRAEEGGE